MLPLKPKLKVLGLSLAKGSSEPLLQEFERLFIYGLMQTLTYFTPVEFVDYAIPAHRVALRSGLPETRTDELRQYCHRFEAGYLLYGSLQSVAPQNGYIEGLYVELRLFDVQRDMVALNIRYHFNDFETTKPEGIPICLPTWAGFQNMLCWATAQLVNACFPERAMDFWNKIQAASLAGNMLQFYQLCAAHYTDMEAGVGPKLSLLNELTHQHTNLFLGHLEKGLLQKRMQNYSQAVLSLQWALRLMTDVTPRQRALCATELGVCYALSRDTTRAVQWWRAAIQEDRFLLNPYMNLAHAMEEAGKPLEAEQYFKQAGEIAPNDSRIHVNLARLYSKQEQWDKAIAQYSTQMLIEPNDPWVYSNMANCYLQKGEINEAKTYLIKTLEMDPDGEAGKCANFILSGLRAAEV